MKKITIAHIIPDDKFFSGKAAFYDQLEDVENLYFFYTTEKNYQFKFIKGKDVDKVVKFNNFFKYVKTLRGKNIDAVLFHGIRTIDAILLCILPLRQKIFWWAWGFDVYDGLNYLPPLLKIELYKPFTEEYVKKNKLRDSWKHLLNAPIRLFFGLIRRYGVSRVDYFIPCMPLEYTVIKKKCKYFRADFFPDGKNGFNYDFVYKQTAGNVLIGNSSTYSNNHLDVFEKLYDLSLLHNPQFVIPLNYGNSYNCGADLIKLSRFKNKNVLWLRDFLKKSDYFSILSTVSHAVFGVLRQQALGNIMYCLRNGIKVYLFKDSLVARQLRLWGIVFYSIDDDLNEESLSQPLSKEAAFHNYMICKSICNSRSLKVVQAEIERIFRMTN